MNEIPIRFNRRILLFLAVMMMAAFPFAVKSEEVRVAVAANFTHTAKKLGDLFEEKTGHKVIYSFAASGQIYAQIVNGAPFDVFLSADAERPQRLEAEGLTVSGLRFVYAYGALVLWSAKPNVDVRSVLTGGRFHKLSIADPAAAPYGIAALETLETLKLSKRVGPKIVKGSTISQAHTYVATGAVEIGFVALSQVQSSGGSFWRVPSDHYSPIDQQAVLLKRGENNPAALAYMAFLRSPEAVAIIRAAGYEVR